MVFPMQPPSDEGKARFQNIEERGKNLDRYYDEAVLVFLGALLDFYFWYDLRRSLSLITNAYFQTG